MGEAVIQCHGVLMKVAEPEETDENHKIYSKALSGGKCRDEI